MVVVFAAVNEAMSPVPLAANPIVVLSFVQVYDVPATPKAEENATAVVAVLAQTVSSVIASTVGVGLTVTSA